MASSLDVVVWLGKFVGGIGWLGLAEGVGDVLVASIKVIRERKEQA